MATPSLQGSLESFKLPDVLTFLNATRKSGTLVAESDGHECQVFFDNGALVFARSNQESFRLGAILLRKKKISRAQADEIERLMAADGARFGQIAIQQGILTEDQLRDFLKIQVSEILYDSFVRKGGTFRFADAMELPSYAVTIAVDLQNLIMEGARRIEEWEECVRLLPDESVIFRVVANPDTEKITLSLDEWKILFLVNGSRTLAELVHDADDDPLRVYRVVYGLFANKLIEPLTGPPFVADDSGTHEAVTEQPATKAVPALDETVRQAPANFGAESTMRDIDENDDTSLLVSSEARLSYKDVVPTTVAQLVISGAETAGTVVPLTESEYLIGRQRDNDIQLADLGISGRHARIFRGPEGFVIEDLKSRNGTWLNGVRVFHALLQNGDQIRIGATDLRYQILYDGAKALAPSAVTE